MSLAACGTVSFSPPSTKIVCPIAKEYTPQQQLKAGEEFAQVKKQYPEISRYVTDYADLRRKIRVCEELSMSK